MTHRLDEDALDDLIGEIANEIRSIKQLNKNAILELAITRDIVYADAQKAYKAAWRRVKSEFLSRDELIYMITQRYDDIYNRNITESDPASQRVALSALDSMCKLHGLNAPIKTQSVNVEISGKSEKEVFAMASEMFEDVKRLTVGDD